MRNAPWVLGVIAVASAPAAPVLAQADYPVVTNFPAPGGTTADTTRMSPPAYDHYSAATTDEYAPSQTDFNAALQAAESTVGGATVQFLNSSSELNSAANVIQIVSDWAIGSALYTVAFPRGWSPMSSYPIVLSGDPTFASNNYRVFGPLFRDASLLSAIAGYGAIGVVSNCGGIESQGVSAGVLRSVGAMLDTLAMYGGDKHRVITAGFSRGAMTAFTWAANPLGLDYTVLAAFGHALPVSFVEAVTAPYATYPMLGSISDLITNDPSRSSYASVPPPHTFPNTEISILTGTTAAIDINTPSVLGDRLRGVQLVFSTGTQDPVLPLPTAMAFEQDLTTRGIPHLMVLVYNGGHELSQKVANEFALALGDVLMGRPYTAPTGVEVDVQTELAQHLPSTQQQQMPGHQPFSAVVPYKSSKGQPMRIDLCGEPGTAYRVCAVRSDGSERALIDVSGAFPAGKCAKLPMATPVESGGYDWRFEVGGQPFSNAMTAVPGLLATLDVSDTQPTHVSALPNGANLPLVAMGVSELSPQTGHAAVACPPLADGGLPDAAGPLLDGSLAPADAAGPGVDGGEIAPDALGPAADAGANVNPDTGAGAGADAAAAGDSASASPDGGAATLGDGGPGLDAAPSDASVAPAGKGCGCNSAPSGPAGSPAGIALLLFGWHRVRRRARCAGRS
jgi:uncharacterized protein (TIGR03382 family)